LFKLKAQIKILRDGYLLRKKLKSLSLLFLNKGDLTSGSIFSSIVLFSIPLLTGYFLQQFYNAIDAVVVGNYVSKNALAAVGSTNQLINMTIAFAMGMFSGASVIVSQFYGAREYRRLRDTIHTTIAISIVLGVVFTILGVTLSPAILRAVRTPPEVLDDSIIYLRIYFGGLAPLLIYNAGAAILTALGDSRRPLIFLLISSILNIIGDLVLVLIFKMGVEGVAISTVFAEVVCAVLVLTTLARSDISRRLIIKEIKVKFGILKRIFSLGIPSAVQGIIVSASNVLVQSYINGLGDVVVAANSAAGKIDAFAGLPLQAMTLVAATFVGQNLGAGDVKRARRGANYSVALSAGITGLISILIIVAREPLLRIFTPETDVIELGSQFLMVYAPLYFVLACTQVLPGALRGAGDVKYSTFVCVGCFVVIRQIYLFIITKFDYSILTVALGYPVTWALASVLIAVRYLKSDWSGFKKP
jgi:putative MATE family efflux protein